jgi:hypothetical protein
VSLAPAKPLEEILETEWDGMLFRGDKSLAAMTGWQLRYHTLRSKGSQGGFPDRVLVRDRIVYAELKREKKTSTPVGAEQKRWLDSLTKAGGECYLWRPSDLDEIGRVLSKRWVFLPRPSEGGRLHEGEKFWTPRSLWVAGVGRYDEIPVVDDGQMKLA